MARFRTICVPLGTHCSPDGDVCATPARVRQWANKFARMKRAGIWIPIAWDHEPDAIPREDEAAFRLSISKFNAGCVDAMYADPETGGLTLEGGCPGVEVDQAGNLVHWVRLPDGRVVSDLHTTHLFHCTPIASRMIEGFIFSNAGKHSRELA